MKEERLTENCPGNPAWQAGSCSPTASPGAPLGAEGRGAGRAWRKIFWSPDLPVPRGLRSKPLLILDSCALLWLFHPYMANAPTSITRRLTALMNSERVFPVVFDFILHETELEEKRNFGRGIVRRGLRQSGAVLVRTGIRGLRVMTRVIDLLPHKHELLKDFPTLYSVDSALIVCAYRLAEGGARVYIVTADRAMTTHLERKGIPNLLELMGAPSNE